MKESIDLEALFSKILGERIDDFIMPPPSFTALDSKIIEFDEKEKRICVSMSIPNFTLNPYGTMQGGMIDAAIDNAVGPLSMLVAPPNMTRTIETKLIKAITMKIEYIYVQAMLVEEKKRRLTFNVSVEDDKGVVYATSKVVNFII